jgi:phospholipid N-methyltransferase
MLLRPEVRFEAAGVPGGFDVIISGLPWTAFPEELKKAILGKKKAW